MLNILINAYAVSPTWGSEPGVGWNWIINIAKSCNVFVITEAEWKEDILKAVERLPQKENIHFYFNPVPQEVRNMCWNQGDWRFYNHYRRWQQKALIIAKEIITQNHIDVIHQLNMIGFREPGYLWQIKDIPFVWGPIGNMAPIPISYLNGSPLKDKLKISVKNIISYYQARTGRVKKAIRRADKLITVLESSADIIQRSHNVQDIIVMPETGLKITDYIEHTLSPYGKIKLLWVGRFIPTKKLDIALQVLSLTKNKEQFELHIVGWGNETDEARYRELAAELGVDNLCIWHGKITNTKVQDLMKTSDVFLFTSVLEGTPHVILEAISNNLPIICFDVCGQGVIVNKEVGWKVPITSLTEATNKMSNILDSLHDNTSMMYEKSKNCEKRKPELSWEKKIERVIEIYNSLQCLNKK